MFNFDALVGDAEQKAESFNQIAIASDGYPWRAAHAQTWADLHTAVAVTQNPNFGSALPTHLETTLEQFSPPTIVQHWRDAIASHIPEHLHDNWANRIQNIDYLADTPKIGYLEEFDTIRAQRLHNVSPQQRVRQLVDASQTESRNAHTAEAHNNVTESIAHTYNAEMLAYHAWIIKRSLYFDDTVFIQADILWELMGRLIQTIPQLPSTVTETTRMLRLHALWTVSPPERPPLLTHMAATTQTTAPLNETAEQR